MTGSTDTVSSRWAVFGGKRLLRAPEGDSLNPIKGCFAVEAAGVGVVDVVSQLVEAAPTHGNALDLAPGAVLGLAGHAVLLDRVLAG
ncbi:MAG: hypothetical protein IH988_09355 [Planctomycetes bacterium]|nr:hypothetical protein [Planctomycetota bacterium]